MFNRAFGLLAFLIGVSLGGFMLFMLCTGRMHNVPFIQIIKMFIMPGVLVAFGVTWMRGATFGAR